MGRAIRTDFPDGSYSKTDFNGWVQITYDQNDTVMTSRWYLEHSIAADPRQVDAANKAGLMNGTPATAHLDPFGRSFYTVDYNITSGNPAFYATQTVLDLENNPLAVIDAMGNTVMIWEYDLVNRQIHQISMDAGERWILHDVMDKPFSQWDVNGANHFVFSYAYDVVHRLLRSNVNINGTDYLTGYQIYGEGIVIDGAADTVHNLRGRLYRQFDQSGVVTHYQYDLQGNLVQSSRTFARVFAAMNTLVPAVLWTGAGSDLALLDDEEYVSVVVYDALNRPVLYSRPFLTASPGMVIPRPYTQGSLNKADLFVPGYGESASLNTVKLYYGGGNTPVVYVARICHNEKGQRLCIQYGNNTVTRYSYDPDTFRLTRLLTTVNTGKTILQDLNYYYDPVGNVTYLLDNAQPPIYYNNQKVLSDGNYTYDAIYRLISAAGREQIAQTTVNEGAANTNYRDYPFDAVPLPAPGDALAMRTYMQHYTYDAVGNMLQLQHVAGTGSYTRIFVYNNSPHPGANNRLIATTVGALPAVNYPYDGHGNMLQLPQLAVMGWNYQDQLAATTQQVVNVGTGETTSYCYDASGVRTRKVTASAAGSGGPALLAAERLYMGQFEIYRSYDGAGKVVLQRETLHVKDDIGRIAAIDNKTIDSAGGDSTVLNTYYPRYQYANQLGSATYELDESGNIVSYEEYHPFGTTSFQAKDGALDVPMKRFRYTGKERDEESGLYYYGARYYPPWLCRWTSADPSGVGAGVNLYGYVKNNPVTLIDPNGMADKKSGILDSLDYAVSIVGYEFAMLTGQRPEDYGMGMVHKIESFTVDPVVRLYGPGGMIDKAARKGVDLAQGKKPEEPTEAEHKQMRNDIITVGAGLFPGGGEVTLGTPKPAVAMAEGGEVLAVGEVAIPNAITKAPAQLLAAKTASDSANQKGSGGGSGDGSGKGNGPGSHRRRASSRRPGKWESDLTGGRNMTPEQAAYQKQVTGRSASKTYHVKGTSFDGFERGVNGAKDKLIEAKYLEEKGRFVKAYETGTDVEHLWGRAEDLLAQARRQVKAAEGTGAEIEWRVSSEKAQKALKELFNEPDLAGKIKVEYVPKTP
jgi:RHS repeat-associated protein